MTTVSAVPAAPEPVSAAAALAHVARAVNSAMPLSEILRRVAELSCEVLDADRATVLLLADGHLVPAVSHGRVADRRALERFRKMPPVRLASIPHALELLRQPDALIIDDVESSPLVPANWRAAFGLRSLAIAPLVADDTPVGALVLDYAGQNHVFSPGEISALEGVAACAASAVTNRRLYDQAMRRAHELDESLRVTVQLNAAITTRAVCDVGLDGLMRVLEASRASLHLLDRDLLTLATRGDEHPEPGVHRLEPRTLTRLRSLLSRGAATCRSLSGLQPFDGITSPDRTLLIPLGPASTAPGFVLVTCDTWPDPMRERLAASIVGQVWLALDRARMAEQTDGRLARLELLYHLSDELTASPDLDGLVGVLAGPLRAATGFELIDIYLLPPRGFGAFSSRPPGKELSALIRRLQRDPTVPPVEHQDLLVVPMRLEGQLRGVIRLRRPLAGQQNAQHDEFLLAIASGVAAVVARARLSAQVAQRESELAVVQERERIAADLHDTLGQSLFALSVTLTECARGTSDEALRSRLDQARGMADSSGTQLRQAIHALAFLHGAEPDLPASLRVLAGELDTTIDVDVRCQGKPRALEPARAEALLRVAQEALVNVKRHSRATRARITLRYRPGQVELVVADNGTGLGQRTSGYDAGLHFGLRTMRRRLEQVQGKLEFQDVVPSGLLITATVPAE